MEIYNPLNSAPTPTHQPPSRWLLLIEGRAVYELASSVLTMSWLSKRHEGDGHPVITLPGFLASDISTGPLRRFLNGVGFSAHRWDLGRNYGPRPGMEEALEARIDEVYALYGGQKVSLVGWSLGGIYARLMAHRKPNKVRSVITLGSPFGGSTRANHAWRLFESFSGQPIDQVDPQTMEHIRTPPPMPSTAVYSRSDGVAHWRSCVDNHEGPGTENVEVDGSHCGLGCNPLVLEVIADRLAQPEDSWQPFERRGARQWLYRHPKARNGTSPEPLVQA